MGVELKSSVRALPRSSESLLGTCLTLFAHCEDIIAQTPSLCRLVSSLSGSGVEEKKVRALHLVEGSTGRALRRRLRAGWDVLVSGRSVSVRKRAAILSCVLLLLVTGTDFDKTGMVMSSCIVSSLPSMPRVFQVPKTMGEGRWWSRVVVIGILGVDTSVGLTVCICILCPSAVGCVLGWSSS